MLTSGWTRRWRLVAALMAGLALGATPVAFAAHGGGGGGGGGGGFSGGHGFGGGGFGRGGVGHFEGRGAYGRGRGYAGRYYGYGRGYYGGWGWRGWGWGGWWWGPGWWGLGLFLPIIPWYYTTYWWDGVPYYYGDGGYYVWNGDVGQYEQVTPPADLNQGAAEPSAPGPNEAPENGPLPPSATTSSELFVYPKIGQSAEQQARDKAECRKWASDQVASRGTPAGGNSTSGGNPAQSAAIAQHQAYLRAEAVCLEGRNYTVG